MKKVVQHTSDKDIQIILGTLLRVGVISSMVIVTIGCVMYLFEHAHETVNYSEFRIDFNTYDSIPKIYRDLMLFKSSAIIQFGILLLIFTPILRIIFSIYSFILEKDYLYVVIGLIVLSIILLSLNGGLAH
ncbi:DUF1634 domain-containing protein [Pedobacter flavus]|uniref:DUF1634 domain-containing protein n=1 Tax=Pedobacter flavus TaxID=3113906 RepID=A0ABU7H0M6_9SPHI|nr:DUF1634 domain-containing protein [Pedobacter sp. VNH31]MEE1884876.1 DUF1634 domain-containing protein [Pedobacter sp. VNH31]